ncbi:MAG: HAMP domain-containing sensor histidine kinase [Polyangiaceae bacterium]
MAESAIPHDGQEARRRYAWDAECLARETREAKVFTVLATVIVPAWTFLDMELEPDLWRRFLALRSLVVLLGGFVAYRLWGTSPNIREIRTLSVALFFTTAAVVAWMVPATSTAYSIYMVGFSLVIFGTGLLMSWPPALAAIAFVSAPLSVPVAHLLQPCSHPAMFQIAAGFYLATASVICFAVMVLRWRLLRRAFDASFQLERRNLELSEALDRLKDTQARLVASEKLSALGRLLAGLSHELNNPMNVIANNLEPMGEHFETVARLLDLHASEATALPDGGEALRVAREEAELDFATEDFRDALAGVSESAKRILGIQDNLRAYVRGASPRSARGDVNDGLRATVGILQRSLPHGVELCADYGALDPIEARFDELNQLHFNLLQNAIDAVGEGGTVTVTTRQLGQGIEIAVTDSGPGFHPELVDHVFEPFFTTKEVGKGTGLGLSICQRIVADHAGTIDVDRRHRGGARVVVTLPRAAIDRAA